METGLIEWKIDFNQYFRIVSKRYKSFSKVVSTVMMGHIRKKNIEIEKHGKLIYFIYN